MPRPPRTSHQYLEKHGGKWRVTIAVPRALHGKLGTRLKRSLNTDSLALANLRKWAVVAEMKAAIEKAQQATGAESASAATVAEGMEWREMLKEEMASAAGGGVLPDLVIDRAEELEGLHGYSVARAFVDVATGRTTPIAPLEGAWLAEAGYAGRTETARKQAVRRLLDWCRASHVPEVVEAIDRRVAGRFVSEVFVAKGVDPATANKLITGLSAFWQWLLRRGHASANPWERQSLKARKVRTESGEEAKRPFSVEEEEAILFTLDQWGQHKERDLFIFLIDTGARLGEALGLTWRDIASRDRSATFWETKAGNHRTVPLTDRAREAVARRRQYQKPGQAGPFTAINRNTLRSLWERLRTHLPFIGDAVMHTFRHTCASRLVQKGVDLMRVRMWMGHKAIQTTLRYSHLAPQHLDDVLRVLQR